MSPDLKELIEAFAQRLRMLVIGSAQWLRPLIPALLEAEASGSPEVRSSRPSWPTWSNPVSIKITKKLARHGGGCL